MVVPEFLTELVNADIKLNDFKTDKEIVQQGLAPLLVSKHPSTLLHKANLLETAKWQNWQLKAHILFNNLAQNKINFLVFKGFAFTHLLYNNSHIRPYSDIDIIVEKVDYHAVVAILIQLGYQQYPSRQGQFVSFQNSFFDNDSPQTIIDLHWQINNRIEFHKYFTFTDLNDRAIELNADKFTFKSLSLTDAFILGCFHYQAHRAIDRKHIWLYDLALLWNKMDVDTQAHCLKSANTSKQSNIVLSTLSLIQKTFNNCFEFYFDLTPLKDETTGFYLQKRKNKLSDIKTRIKNIDGTKNKLKFVAEYIFQSKVYVKNRYQLKSKTWLFLYYPKMWLEDLYKLFKKS